MLPTNNVLVNALRNFEHAFGLKQLIVEPTRVCINKASAIDLILVSDPEKVCQSGVLLCVGISDHLLTYCTRKVTRAYVNKHKTIRIRSSKKYSQEQFTHNLNETDWTDVLNSVDADLAWVRFKSIFVSVLDKIAPFKTIRIKQRTQPWMSTEMIKLINPRDNYLRQFRKSKNQSDYELFIYHRNQVKYKKEMDKSQYYINVVNENKNRPKKLGQILKEVGASNKCKTKESSISLVIGNELCFDKVKVATHCNDFFHI